MRCVISGEYDILKKGRKTSVFFLTLLIMDVPGIPPFPRNSSHPHPYTADFMRSRTAYQKDPNKYQAY